MAACRRPAACVLFAATLLLAGCKPDYPKCKKTAHCAEKGEVCIEGFCKECGEDAHCREGFVCKGGACVTQAECRLDLDCGEGRRCRQGRCGAECGLDRDCAAGARCREGRCVAGPECTADGDCAGGQACREGRCERDEGAAGAGEDEDERARRLKALQGCEPAPVLFPFNEAALDDAARATLDRDAECIRARKLEVVVEGHADERGTEEYNLVLGEKRANAVKRYLAGLGLDEATVRTVSYGETRPDDPGHDEAAWAKNRRAELKFR